MEKKFYRISTFDFITHVNIDHIVEWRINYEGELKIYSVDNQSYEIMPNDTGYKELLKALQGLTV